MAIFILVPLGIIVYYVMTAAAPDGGVVFTLDNLIKAFDPLYMGILGRSVWLAFIATCVCLLIGYPVALILTSRNFKKGSLLIILFVLPMWMNFLLRTYAWMTLLEDSGVINNILSKINIGPYHMINTSGAVILGMVYNFLPYMILPIYSVMTKLDNSLIEAAQDLGANRFHVIKDVIFPSTLSGVVSGVTMVFVPSVSTFYISQKLGGGSFALIGDIIEMQFQVSNNFNFGAALSLVLMILILICMAVMNKFGDTEEAGGVVA